MATYTAHCINGIFEDNIKMYVDKRLKNHPGAQAGIVQMEDGNTLLYSYATLAARIDENGFLFIRCTCSHSTCNHIRWFIDEYAPNFRHMSFQTMKKLQAACEGININTGEIIKDPEPCY